MARLYGVALEEARLEGCDLSGAVGLPRPAGGRLRERRVLELEDVLDAPEPPRAALWLARLWTRLRGGGR